MRCQLTMMTMTMLILICQGKFTVSQGYSVVLLLLAAGITGSRNDAERETHKTIHKNCGVLYMKMKKKYECKMQIKVFCSFLLCLFYVIIMITAASFRRQYDIILLCQIFIAFMTILWPPTLKQDCFLMPKLIG